MATSPKTDAPPGKSQPKSRTQSTSPPPPMEYKYMYEQDKSPSKLLDALLRAIARHIVCDIGDKGVGQLTPDKLAAFYKAVGGDYDSLFVNMPHPSISYVWQVTGCQHTLQPTENDFAPPSIPALTPRGFSRWESLEILLGPEEHVPFLQFAVKNWKLKHPETGQDFPPDLPRSVFPSTPDYEVDEWHKSCAEKLRKEASRERERDTATGSGPEPDHPEPKVAYAHVRKPFQSRGPPYGERPVSFNHVPGRHGSGGRMPSRSSPERYHQERDLDEQARRRSFSDYNIPQQPEAPSYSHGSTYLDPNSQRPAPSRRHSQPRHFSSESSDDEPIPPRTTAPRRQNTSPPCPPRFVDPSGQQSSPPPMYRRRSDLRPEDTRRRAAQSPSFREKVTEAASNILPNGLGADRIRNRGRPPTYTTESSRPRRSREFQPRVSRSRSDQESDASSEEDDSGEDYRRQKMREERDKDRDRDRFRDVRGRPKDFDDDRRDRQYLRRPAVERRTSSHADMERRRDHQGWDPRVREQLREEKKRWEKRIPPEERGTSPMTGASSRRYPEASYS